MLARQISPSSWAAPIILHPQLIATVRNAASISIFTKGSFNLHAPGCILLEGDRDRPSNDWRMRHHLFARS